jgi:hypothetical protein
MRHGYLQAIGPTAVARIAESRQLPTTTMELAGHATGTVIEGLTARSPWMLGIILLNVAGITAAVYFLNLLIRGQSDHMEQIMTVQQTDMQRILETHNREFDALMAMLRDAAAKPPLILPAPLPPTEIPAEEPPPPKKRP